MDIIQPFGSPNFAIVAKGLVSLHKFIRDGEDDSPEAESIRDALDDPLDALDVIEKKRSQWLSEDLFSVSEPSATFKLKELNPQARQGIDEATRAWENLEWDLALTLLRRWKDYIPPADLSFRRGAI